MREFTENQPLLASIKANDIDEIKRILIDNIFFLQGDENEISKAAEYAVNNSDFNFDEHVVLEVSNKKDKEDYFSDEKWNMRENYSRERYNFLVELYHETFAKQDYTYELDKTPKKDGVSKEVKVIVGGVIVIVAGYLIYKILG